MNSTMSIRRTKRRKMSRMSSHMEGSTRIKIPKISLMKEQKVISKRKTEKQ
jgi:hypothetical protein